MKIKFFALTFTILVSLTSAFAADAISYTGRLVNSNGSPVTGPVQLKLDLYYSGDLSTLKCSKTFFGVPLKNGVFHINVDYASTDCGSRPFSQIIQEIPNNETMALSVTDVTHSKTYSHHTVHAVPLSILSAAAKTLTAPPAGTPSGHVLKWNGTSWEAAADGGGGGTVTGITAGTGINVTQNVNDYTVSIASGNPNEIRVNDATGAMSSISLLPLIMGGTGATTALGARTNLGLGTSAVANTGFANGNVLPADGIAYCLPGTKLNVTALPTVMWTCSPEDSDNTKLPLAGGTMSGAIDMGTNKITNLGAPAVGTDAATKAYVDSAASAASTSVWSLNGSDVYRSLGNVGVGTNTPQAALDVTSTTSGVLVPRMTTAQRDAIASPLAGMVLYNTSTSKINFYDGAWKELGIAGAGITSINIGTGLTPAGAFTSGGTIAIAAGGVSSTELANSAVTDAKIATGVSRAKLASGTSNHVLINDGTGAMSSEASLAITRGGTGLTALGTSNQIIGMNNAAGAMEYKSILAGAGMSVTHTANTITLTSTGSSPTGAAGGDLSGTYPNPTLNTVTVSKGGTGLTSLTPRGILSGDATGTAIVGTACASGQYLGFNVSGDPTCYNVSNITSNSFVNNGNTFGADATLGTNDANALIFETNNTPRMTINSTGNVAIGTSVFSSKFQVGITDNTDVVFGPRDDVNNNFRFLSKYTDGFSYIQTGINSSDTAAKLKFSRMGTAFTLAEVRFNSDNTNFTGNVGVGVFTPNERLTVQGVMSLAETTSPTATANYGKLYVKATDSKLYFMDDAGNEAPVGTPAAGSISSSMIQDGSIVDADVSASASIAQSKIANLTTDLAGKQASDPELTAVAGLSTDGIMVKNGAGSVVTRTILGAAGRTFVSNGNGATGNPTVDISNGLLPSPLAGDAGKLLKATGADTSSWQALVSGDITTALGFTPINSSGDTINSGAFTFGGSSVVRVLDPILPTDAANRQWVESRISSSTFVNNGNDFGGNAVLGTNGAGQDLGFETAGTTKMTISAAGNVGIGTVAPALKLQVESTSDATIGSKSTTSTGYAGMNMYDSTGANAASFQYGNPSAPSFANEFVVASRQAAIPLKFYQGGVTAGNERLRIDSSSQILMLNSNVGIGTINPTSKLEVNAPVDAAFTTQFKLTDGTTGGYWSISDGATGALVYLPTFEFASTGVAGFGGVMVGRIPSANDAFSANNAAIAIDGRTTTGTALSNANLMSVRNNGSAVMTVKANGNLGVGTTNPSTKVAISSQNISTNYTTSNTTGVLSLLDNTTPSAVGIGPKIVFGSTYYTLGSTLAAASIGSYKEFAPSNGFDEYKHSLVFNTSNNGTGVTEKMRITSDGYVGIGTTAPERSIHVVGNGDVNDDVLIESNNDLNASGSLLAMLRSRGTNAAKTPPLTNDILSEVSSRGWTDSGYVSAGEIYVRASTDWATNQSSFMGFHTRNNGVLGEKMRITATGNIGIGTSTPTSKLQVAGTIETTSGGIKFPDGSVQTTASNSGMNMQKGTIGACTPASAGSSGSVTFPTAFPGNPLVQLTVVELDNTGCTSARITAISATGFSWTSWVGGTAANCDCIYWTAFY